MIPTANIDLLTLIEREAPFVVHSRANVHGITEYHGNCPWCPGTTDSFVISCYPDGNRFSHNVPGRAGCGRSGDAIDFIQEWKDMDFLEAVAYLQLEDALEGSTMADRRPLVAAGPNAQWLSSAGEFALRTHRLLFSEHGRRALGWLRDRGFADKTLLKFQIGFLPSLNGSKFHKLKFSDWGLQPLSTDKNQECFFVRYGIVIPYYKGNKIQKLEIRKPVVDEYGKYQSLRGSVDTLFNQDQISSARPCIVTEGAFDAMSGDQELGDSAAFVATGGSKYSGAWKRQVEKASHVFVSFDAEDGNGRKCGEEWKKALPTSIVYPPIGHDLNDMLINKEDFPAWLEDGMMVHHVVFSSKKVEQVLEDETCQRCGTTTKSEDVEVCYWPLDVGGNYTTGDDYVEVKCYCLKCDEELHKPRVIGANGHLTIEDYWSAGEQTNYRAIVAVGLRAGKAHWQRFLAGCKPSDITRVILSCGVISVPPPSQGIRLIDVDDEIRVNADLIIKMAEEIVPHWKTGNLQWLLSRDSTSIEFQGAVRELFEVQKKFRIYEELPLYVELMSV